MTERKGLDNGLTNYGDPDFARFLRPSFARSMGISRELLDKPVVGIAMTPSGFNNCHRYMPELVERVASLSITRCTSRSPGTAFSNSSRKRRNSLARWRG